MRVLSNVDLSKNEIQQAVIQPLTSPPEDPKEGQIYYNSTNKSLYAYDGETWQVVGKETNLTGYLKNGDDLSECKVTITDGEHKEQAGLGELGEYIHLLISELEQAITKENLPDGLVELLQSSHYMRGGIAIGITDTLNVFDKTKDLIINGKTLSTILNDLAQSTANYLTKTGDGSSLTVNGKVLGALITEILGKFSKIDWNDIQNKPEISGGKDYLGRGFNSFQANDTCAATEWYSFAEGYDAKSHGIDAHAEGRSTVAKGYNSHAEGEGTCAMSKNQHAQGQFNIEDRANVYAHITGNGTDFRKRSNAFTIKWDGTAQAYGTPVNDEDLVTIKYLKDKGLI